MAIQIQIITGFLGSGKTTLVRHLLEGPGQPQTGVVVGEFAEEGFDGQMIEATGAIVSEMAASGHGESAKSYLPPVRDFIEEGQVSHIILETSGVTEIAKVTSDLAQDPLIQKEAVFGPTVVVVDASSFDAHDQFFPQQFWTQIDVADVVAVNKTDKVDGDTLDRIRERIKARNPEARIQFIYQGQIHRATARQIPYEGFEPRAMRASWGESLPTPFESFVYRSKKPCLDQVAFGHLLLNLPGGEIARFKGALRTYGGTVCLNGMPGQLDWDKTPMSGETRIAFIGLDLEKREAEVKRALDEELDKQLEEARKERR